MKKSLSPVQEISVDTKSIIIGSFIFAFIFFAIGSLWRYYVGIGV